MFGDKKISNIQEAMAALGATEDLLTADEKSSLDEKGFVIFRNVVEPEWLERMREVYEQLMAKEGQSAGTEFGQEKGTRRLADLINKNPVFDRAYTIPKVLAAVYYVLKREFKVSNMNGRDAIPGEGNQGLHMDFNYILGEPFHAVTCLLMLDDFTPDNGATRVVPGTHRLGINPRRDWADKAAAWEPHPDEVILTSPAGSVGVMISHLWHGGTQNKTNSTRRALHPFYVGREHPQQLDQHEYIRVKTYKRISPAARYLLDVE
jgi:ectoine hydroxylase-related dioxygenase (phytanoyl-CoA dioxygenase family)